MHPAPGPVRIPVPPADGPVNTLSIACQRPVSSRLVLILLVWSRDSLCAVFYPISTGKGSRSFIPEKPKSFPGSQSEMLLCVPARNA